MKKLFRNILVNYLLFAAVFLCACTKHIEFEGENAKPKLVLNGLMMTDSVFVVELSKSMGYVDPGSPEVLENGTVDVFNQSGEYIESLWHTADGIYKGNAVPQPGEKYTVKASSADFNEISAMDYLPESVSVLNWDTSRTFGHTEIEEGRINFTFSIADPPESADFYQIQFFQSQAYYVEQVEDSTGQETNDTIYLEGPMIVFPLTFSTNEPILLEENDAGIDNVDFSSASMVFSDELFNGNTRSFSLNLDNHMLEGNLVFMLSSCSADYYNYLRTKQRLDEVTGDPFSEPVQVFSNIEGDGFGIWGGVAADIVIIEL